MFLIDNNLSPKLVKRLIDHFPKMAHVADFGLEDDSDHRVWNFAKKNKYPILTKDTDFISILNLRGFPPKVIRLNCGNITTKEVEGILLREKTVIYDFLTSNKHGLPSDKLALKNRKSL